MIVNKHPEGWEIIFQRAHGLLAADIASYWKPSARTRRWTQTLAAIAQHDNEQVGWEGRRWLTDIGTPMDFGEREVFDLDQPKRVARASMYQGRWVALLTSMHLTFLYGHMKGERGEASAFLKGLEARQVRWRKELGVSKGEAERAYALMQWCDRLSLILCRRELPDGERHLEIGAVPGEGRHTVLRRGDGSVGVEPWPFEAVTFEVSVDAYYLTRLTYEDDRDLAGAVEEAEVRELTWRFSK